MMMVTTLWAAAATLATGCEDDMGCSLNGACSAAGECACDPPWTGPTCGRLGFAKSPAAATGAYGLGTPFAVTSWGGNAIRRGDTWHLYVTEMSGDHCGLHVWGSQSTVAHAVSPNASGPYVKISTVLQHEAHNPETIEIDGALYIFHIGTANSVVPAAACNATASRQLVSGNQSGLEGREYGLRVTGYGLERVRVTTVASPWVIAEPHGP